MCLFLKRNILIVYFCTNKTKAQIFHVRNENVA